MKETKAATDVDKARADFLDMMEDALVVFRTEAQGADCFNFRADISEDDKDAMIRIAHESGVYLGTVTIDVAKLVSPLHAESEVDSELTLFFKEAIGDLASMVSKMGLAIYDIQGMDLL